MTAIGTISEGRIERVGGFVRDGPLHGSSVEEGETVGYDNGGFEIWFVAAAGESSVRWPHWDRTDLLMEGKVEPRQFPAFARRSRDQGAIEGKSSERRLTSQPQASSHLVHIGQSSQSINALTFALHRFTTSSSPSSFLARLSSKTAPTSEQIRAVTNSMLALSNSSCLVRLDAGTVRVSWLEQRSTA